MNDQVGIYAFARRPDFQPNNRFPTKKIWPGKFGGRGTTECTQKGQKRGQKIFFWLLIGQKNLFVPCFHFLCKQRQ
jgi:hypothetical protein